MARTYRKEKYKELKKDKENKKKLKKERRIKKRKASKEMTVEKIFLDSKGKQI